MDEQLIVPNVGKNAFFITKQGQKYFGLVKAVSLGTVTIIDKYNNPVFISCSEIATFEVKE